MKCELCHGTGELLGLHGIYEKCPVCNGSGSDGQQTNEEWFCALPTKEKAKWLASKQCGHKVMQELKAKAWEEWLQKKHVDD